MCRKKARAFASWRGRGTGKDSMYLGMGVGNPASFQNGVGEGWVRKPKTDPVLVLDGFKFKSLICHQLTTASICWLSAKGFLCAQS